VGPAAGRLSLSKGFGRLKRRAGAAFGVFAVGLVVLLLAIVLYEDFSGKARGSADRLCGRFSAGADSAGFFDGAAALGAGKLSCVVDGKERWDVSPSAELARCLKEPRARASADIPLDPLSLYHYRVELELEAGAVRQCSSDLRKWD
jgi:hypothetical protein